MRPTCSVILPVYNASATVKEAILSMIGQTMDDLEIIIVNDASTDDSEKVIQSIEDPRIRYFANTRNVKLSNVLNFGMAQGEGKYIARMDADDCSLPHRLERQVKFLEDNPDIDVCGSSVETYEGEVWQIGAPHELIEVRMLFFNPVRPFIKTN